MQRLIEEDLVKVNGKPTKASYKIKNGDVVIMVAPPERVKRTEKLTGPPDEVAQKIVEKLKLEVKVL